MNILSWKVLINYMEDILSAAQKKRSERPGFTDAPNGYGNMPERIPNWALYEMNEMLAAVNLIRVSKFKSAITLKEIIKVEGNARGHSDYSHKFALYCAELARDN